MTARIHAMLGLAVVFGAGAIAPAQAHVVLKEPTATSGAYYVATFRVPHGCGTSPTVSITVALPEGVVSAKPRPQTGWRIEVTQAPLATPVPTEGRTLTDRPTQITWTGGPLPDEWFEEFSISLKLPAEVGKLYFPVVQRCEVGELRWIEIPAEGKSTRDLRHPAPALTLTPPPPAHERAH